MANPILAMLNGAKTNNIMQQLSAINNPDAMFNQMLNSNPQFRQFVESNKGKTPEQIARENGIDPQLLHQFIK